MWTEALWSCWWKCNSMQPLWKCSGVAYKGRHTLWETALSVPVLRCLGCAQCLQPSGLHPARLLCPWDFPGKDTGVGCHAFLQRSCWTLLNLAVILSFFMNSQAGSLQLVPPGKAKVKELVAQLCPTLCNPIDGSQAPLSMDSLRQEYWRG